MVRESLGIGSQNLNTNFRDPCPDFRGQISVCPDFRSPWRDSCPDFPDLMSRQIFQTQTLGATLHFGSKSGCSAIFSATHVQTFQTLFPDYSDSNYRFCLDAFFVQDMIRKNTTENEVVNQKTQKHIHHGGEEVVLGCAVSASVWKIAPSPPWSGKSCRLHPGLESGTKPTSVATNVILVTPPPLRSKKLRRLRLGLKSRAVSGLVWKVTSSPPS